MENYVPPDVAANFFLLYKDNSAFLEGWVCLDEDLNDFILLLQDEIIYSWGSEYANMEDYHIFYIDEKDKNNLKKIIDQKTYDEVRALKEIYIVFLHKEIEYRFIENIPLVFEWFQKQFPPIKMMKIHFK